MTNEEVERSIEFLLQGQANLESQMARSNSQMESAFKQIEQLSEQVRQVNEQVGVLAESQNEFTQIVLQHITAQGKINEGQREINADVRDSIRVLTATVEKYFSDGRNGNS